MIERRHLGKTGMEVSVLGFGGSEIGYERASRATVDRLLGEALDAGLNVIDTAECYPRSEALIGQTVSHRRADYFLFTKCGHATSFNLPDWHPALLGFSIERSLKLLQTDHLDLIQLHSCDEDVLRKGAVLGPLATARRQGKVLFVGYSGDGAAALAAVRSGAFDVLQTSVSVADQEAIEKTLPEAAARGMGVIAKRPLANTAWKTGSLPDDPYHHEYWERLNVLRYPFLGGPLPAAIGTALRFTLAVPQVHTAIVGTKTPGRFRENAALLAAGPLPAEEYEAIRHRWREVAKPGWTGQQ